MAIIFDFSRIHHIFTRAATKYKINKICFCFNNRTYRMRKSLQTIFHSPKIRNCIKKKRRQALHRRRNGSKKENNIHAKATRIQVGIFVHVVHQIASFGASETSNSACSRRHFFQTKRVFLLSVKKLAGINHNNCFF